MSEVILSTNQSVTSLSNLEVLKTEHMLQVVVRLVNTFNCLAYYWKVKHELNLT